MQILKIVEGGEYYQQLILCDWCGRQTHGRVEKGVVNCTSCHRELLQLYLEKKPLTAVN